jgi:GNAT superfamily N-acetyltransferase
MLNIKKIEAIDAFDELKQQYINQTSAPLDGMWLCGFLPMASHYGFYQEQRLVGYCCINSDGYLLQFYLEPSNQHQAAELFAFIAGQKSEIIGQVKGAFVSTAEPQYLSFCLDHYSKFDVNAKMYQHQPIRNNQQGLPMTMVKTGQLTEFVTFAHANVGAPEQWLTGYYDKLISRGELFGFWQNEQLLVAGECRLYDKYQTDFVDVGMIVAKAERGKGLATKALNFLTNLAYDKGLKPLCSTEKDNLGAQKAIGRAGFVAQHRILRFDIA